MFVPRYDTSGKWYKGNTHIHSVASDGGLTLEELSVLYSGNGYYFLFVTDHWICSDVAPENKKALPLLLLDGIEIDGMDCFGAYYHILCLGKLENIDRGMGVNKALDMAREQGAFVILAHPFWCGNSMEDALRWHFDGVEIYNHECVWFNGKSNGLVHWHCMLEKNVNTKAFASDDAHIRSGHPTHNGGWICLNTTDALGEKSVIASLRAGNFYSSCGPEIYDVSYGGESGLDVSVRTSNVKIIKLVGPSTCGKRIFDLENGVTEAKFSIPEKWAFAYIEIEDMNGKTAWTNTLFKQEKA